MTQPFFIGEGWMRVSDGNDAARQMFHRHYSRRRYTDGRRPLLFVGPGQKMVLVTACGRALFAWRKFISRDGQQGLNCAIFRNEGAGLSSDLVRAADEIADDRWPGERHYSTPGCGSGPCGGRHRCLSWLAGVGAASPSATSC